MTLRFPSASPVPRPSVRSWWEDGFLEFLRSFYLFSIITVLSYCDMLPAVLILDKWGDRPDGKAALEICRRGERVREWVLLKMSEGDISGWYDTRSENNSLI